MLVGYSSHFTFNQNALECWKSTFGNLIVSSFGRSVTQCRFDVRQSCGVRLIVLCWTQHLVQSNCNGVSGSIFNVSKPMFNRVVFYFLAQAKHVGFPIHVLFDPRFEVPLEIRDNFNCWGKVLTKLKDVHV